MKQMDIDKKYLIPVDSEDADVPKSVKLLKPVLFHEGDAFCCLLGPDPQEGIFGCGQTQQQALEDWDMHAKERLKGRNPDDSLAKEITTNLDISIGDLW